MKLEGKKLGSNVGENIGYNLFLYCDRCSLLIYFILILFFRGCNIINICILIWGFWLRNIRR